MTFLDWTSNLPAHWRAKPLRAVTDYVVSNVDKIPADNEIPVRLCNYTDVYNNEFITLDLDFMQGTATEAEIAKFGLKIDDVLITKDSESWDDIGVPALVKETADDLVCGYHLAMLRPRADSLHGSFLFRCLQAKPVRVQLELAANGVTRFGIPKSEIGAMTLPVPPLPIQRAIANYLDRETAQIDALVAAKERLLVLLAEKRRALIERAVTRGLDPHAPLRESGVPWLGQVPAHWEIKPLKYAVTFQRGHDLPQEERAEGNVPIISSAGQFAWHNRSVAKAPGIVTGRYGTVGEFYLVEQPFWPLNTTLYSINLHDNHPRFLWYMLQSMTDLFLLHAGKSAVPGVDRNDLHPIPVAVPPVAEQREITTYLDIEITKLDALAAAAERSIALLKERRAALIAAAVTGRVDVPIS